MADQIIVDPDTDPKELKEAKGRIWPYFQEWLQEHGIAPGREYRRLSDLCAGELAQEIEKNAKLVKELKKAMAAVAEAEQEKQAQADVVKAEESG